MSSYLHVLRHRDFRLLFLGQSASAVGDQIVIVALALYITRTTGSPTDLGLVLMAQSLPMVVLILVGGVLADRGGGRRRVRIMVGSDIVRALLHGGFAVLIFAGTVPVWQMFVIEAAFGAARAFFQPAFTGLVPATVPEEEILEARALTQATGELAILVGPAIGTLLMLTLGAGTAIAIDAGTFVVSSMLLIPIKARERGAGADAGESMLAGLRGGWVEVRSRPWVWVTIVAFTGFMFSVYAQWYALAPVIARDHYGSANVFGWLEALSGAGSVTATVVAIRWRPAHPMGIGLALCLLWPLCNGLLAGAVPLVVVAASAVAAGFGVGLFIVWWETALAHHIPPGVLSRVSAYDWMGALALLPAGFAVAGPLAAAFGARTVLAVGAVVGAVLMLAAMLPESTRRLSGAPASAEELGGDVGVAVGGEA